MKPILFYIVSFCIVSKSNAQDSLKFDIGLAFHRTYIGNVGFDQEAVQVYFHNLNGSLLLKNNWRVGIMFFQGTLRKINGLKQPYFWEVSPTIGYDVIRHPKLDLCFHGGLLVGNYKEVDIIPSVGQSFAILTGFSFSYEVFPQWWFSFSGLSKHRIKKSILLESGGTYIGFNYRFK